MQRSGTWGLSHNNMTELRVAAIQNTRESVFSVIVSKMPKNIKARTEKGFMLKCGFELD